jgi:hypothetical protein
VKKRKKVIILIVEGISDRTLFYERLYNKYSPIGIKFKIYNGDIFHEPTNKASIKTRVGNAINPIMKENKFDNEDILAVIHVMDTDGCFIPGSSVIHTEGQDRSTLYHNESISVAESHQVSYIQERNSIKKGNVNTMCSVAMVRGNKINYRLFYFSRNLEHVLFNDPNIDNGKVEKVEQFLAKLDIPLEDFLGQFMPSVDSDEFDYLYSESWEKIKEDNNSLKRETNSSLLFKYLDEII